MDGDAGSFVCRASSTSECIHALLHALRVLAFVRLVVAMGAWWGGLLAQARCSKVACRFM